MISRHTLVNIHTNAVAATAGGGGNGRPHLVVTDHARPSSINAKRDHGHHDRTGIKSSLSSPSHTHATPDPKRMQEQASTMPSSQTQSKLYSNDMMSPFTSLEIGVSSSSAMAQGIAAHTDARMVAPSEDTPQVPPLTCSPSSSTNGGSTGGDSDVTSFSVMLSHRDAADSQHSPDRTTCTIRTASFLSHETDDDSQMEDIDLGAKDNEDASVGSGSHCSLDSNGTDSSNIPFVGREDEVEKLCSIYARMTMASSRLSSKGSSHSKGSSQSNGHDTSTNGDDDDDQDHSTNDPTTNVMSSIAEEDDVDHHHDVSGQNTDVINASNQTSQLVLVHGLSGSGKSRLVQSFVDTISGHTPKGNRQFRTPHYCRGKYDQFNSTMLSAIVDAFTDLFDKLQVPMEESYTQHEEDALVEEEAERRRIIDEVANRMDPTRRALLASVIPAFEGFMTQFGYIDMTSEEKLHRSTSTGSRKTPSYHSLSHHSLASRSLGLNEITESGDDDDDDDHDDDVSIAASFTSNSTSLASKLRMATSTAIKSKRLHKLDEQFEHMDSTVVGNQESRWSQIIYCFKVLAQVIPTMQRPLVIYLDDLQWSDQRSMDLITDLMIDSSIHNLLIIGSYRTDEVEGYGLRDAQQQRQMQASQHSATSSDGSPRRRRSSADSTAAEPHPLKKAIETWEKAIAPKAYGESHRFFQRMHTIEIRNLKVQEVSTFLSRILHVEETTRTDFQLLVRTIHKQTGGNLFHILQTITELKRKGIVYKEQSMIQHSPPSCIPRSSFRWDIARVMEEMEAVADVLDLVLSKLYSMPTIVQDCLKIASFLRSNFQKEVLRRLMQNEFGDGIDVDAALDVAVHEKLLVCVDYHKKTKRSGKRQSSTNLHGSPNRSNPAASGQLQPQPQQPQQQQHPYGQPRKPNSQNLQYETDESVGFDDIWADTPRIQRRKSRQVYQFAHDKIQQASLSLISSGKELQLFRLRMGRHLRDLADDAVFGETWMSFVAADQLFLASSSPEIQAQIPTMEMIELNVKVGEMAMDVSAYVPASNYLNRATKDLETKVEEPWTNARDICLRAYKAMLNTQLYIGNYKAGEDLGEIILKHSTAVTEKIEVNSLLGLALCRDERYADALKMMMGALKGLNTFPRRYHLVRTLYDNRIIQRYLDKHTDDDILNLPPMTNHRVLYTMQALRSMLIMAFFSKNIPTALFAVVRQVRLTFEYGLSGEGANAFSALGIMSLNILKQKDKAKRAIGLASKILARTQSKHVHSQAISASTAFVTAWWEPLDKVLESFHSAYRTGIESGDLEHAYRSRASVMIVSMMSGISLRQIQKAGMEMMGQMDHYRIQVVSKGYAPIQNMVEVLIGIDDVFTDWRDISHVPPVESMKPSVYARWGFFLWSRIQLATYFGDLDLALEIIPKLEVITKDEFSYATETIRVYHAGLTYSRIFLGTGKRKHFKHARSYMKQMRKIVKLKSDTNNYHRYLLMKATLIAEPELAKPVFDSAIAEAARLGFVQDCALANELAAEYYLSTISEADGGEAAGHANSGRGAKKRPSITKSNVERRSSNSWTPTDKKTNLNKNHWPSYYLRNASILYGEWGAAEKVQHLHSKYRNYLAETQSKISRQAASQSRRQQQAKRQSTSTRACLAVARRTASKVSLESS